MEERAIWRCIICAREVEGRPPRRCPTCGTPAARFRMVVERAPKPGAAEPARDGPKSKPSEPAPPADKDEERTA